MYLRREKNLIGTMLVYYVSYILMNIAQSRPINLCDLV